MTTIKKNGNRETIKFFLEMTKVKLAKIANNVCPAIKLANSRIPKLKGLEKYDITSIPIKNGFNILGAPDGIKVFTNSAFCIKIPIVMIEIKN